MSTTHNDGNKQLHPPPETAYRYRVPNPANARGAQFAELIHAGRTKLGISQDELAERAHMSRYTIIRWESGETTRPEPDQVRTVCSILNIDPRRAAVALGFLTEEEIGAPTTTAEPVDPRVEEILALLESGHLPPAEVDHWIDYLKFLQARALQGRKRTAG